MTFELIKENEWLIYEYRRGSQLYGLNTNQSDEDFGGIFMQPNPYLYGLRCKYVEQVADEKNDRVWYELNKFMSLLVKSNPTVLEALFVDKDNIVMEHHIMSLIKEHREEFVTKQCFSTFGTYAVRQIEKARFLNKKIAQPMVEKKDLLDFCYVPYKQGSIELKKWLQLYTLEQQYIGLVNIPNMQNTSFLYYDWKRFFNEKGISISDLITANEDKNNNLYSLVQFLIEYLDITQDFKEKISIWYNTIEVLGYKGIIRYKENNNVSTELIFSSVPQNEKALTIMHYNLFSFQTYCKEYREYKLWEKERNPVRYESTLIENYDSKNMMHCFRLMQMCIEIAKGEGVILNRTNIDKELLLDIKNHKFEYKTLLNLLYEKQAEMNDAIQKSKIKESISQEEVEKLLLKIRQRKIDHYY